MEKWSKEMCDRFQKLLSSQRRPLCPPLCSVINQMSRCPCPDLWFYTNCPRWEDKVGHLLAAPLRISSAPLAASITLNKWAQSSLCTVKARPQPLKTWTIRAKPSLMLCLNLRMFYGAQFMCFVISAGHGCDALLLPHNLLQAIITYVSFLHPVQCRHHLSRFNFLW